MNEEKVLAYLNIGKTKKTDKFLSKIVLGFNFGFTLFVDAMLLLISFSKIHVAFTILFACVDLLFLVLVILYKNPAWQFLIESSGLLLVIAKLMVGYFISSKEQYLKDGFPMFSWAHFAVLLGSCCVAVYVVNRMYSAYQIIMKYPIEKARRKISNQNHVPKWVIAAGIVIGVPLFLVGMFRDNPNNLGLGLGFVCWSLACLFMILFAAGIPKVVVTIRYSVYRYFLQ